MEIIPIFGMVTGVFITLGFFAAIVLSIRYVTTAKNKEKMALIEKGVDISEIYSNKEKGNSTLKIGMFLVAIALGLFVGEIVYSVTKLNDFVAYATPIILFGGASLILFHWYNSKQSAKGS